MATPGLPELVLDSRLEAKFHFDEYRLRKTTHTRYLNRGKRQEETWKRTRELGTGGHGLVWLESSSSSLGRGRQSQTRAVKIINTRGKNMVREGYVRELEALAKFSQDKYVDFFVKSLGWFESKDALFISMEYCEHGDLKHYLKEHGRLSEAEVQDISWQLVRGLVFMHGNGFAHRDLKPANILIKERPPNGDWHVKICDLGLSKRVKGDLDTTTVKGTPGFMPPEILFPDIDKDPRKADPFSGDMWCLGETIFQLLTNRSTFCNGLGGLLEHARSGQGFPIVPLQKVGASNQAIQFIQDLMSSDPSLRPAAVATQNHPWISSFDNHQYDSDNESSSSEMSDWANLKAQARPSRDSSDTEQWSAEWTKTGDIQNEAIPLKKSTTFGESRADKGSKGSTHNAFQIPYGVKAGLHQSCDGKPTTPIKTSLFTGEPIRVDNRLAGESPQVPQQQQSVEDSIRPSNGDNNRAKVENKILHTPQQWKPGSVITSRSVGDLHLDTKTDKHAEKDELDSLTTLKRSKGGDISNAAASCLALIKNLAALNYTPILGDQRQPKEGTMTNNSSLSYNKRNVHINSYKDNAAQVRSLRLHSLEQTDALEGIPYQPNSLKSSVKQTTSTEFVEGLEDDFPGPIYKGRPTVSCGDLTALPHGSKAVESTEGHIPKQRTQICNDCNYEVKGEIFYPRNFSSRAFREGYHNTPDVPPGRKHTPYLAKPHEWNPYPGYYMQSGSATRRTKYSNDLYAAGIDEGGLTRGFMGRGQVSDPYSTQLVSPRNQPGPVLAKSHTPRSLAKKHRTENGEGMLYRDLKESGRRRVPQQRPLASRGVPEGSSVNWSLYHATRA